MACAGRSRYGNLSHNPRRATGNRDHRPVPWDARSGLTRMPAAIEDMDQSATCEPLRLSAAPDRLIASALHTSMIRLASRARKERILSVDLNLSRGARL